MTSKARPLVNLSRTSLTSSILATEIWEAPDVAQANGISDAGEEEVKLAFPGASVRDLLFRLLGSLFLQGFGLVLLEGCLLPLQRRVQQH